MNIADELMKLQELHRNGILTTEEFAKAKERLLGNVSSATEQALQDQIAQLKLQAELNQLEQDWEKERQSYLVWREHSAPYVPTKEAAFWQGGLCLGLGVFSGLFAIGLSTALFFWCLGAFGFLGFIGFCWTYSRAIEYDEAYQAYQLRRADLLSRHESTTLQP